MTDRASIRDAAKPQASPARDAGARRAALPAPVPAPAVFHTFGDIAIAPRLSAAPVTLQRAAAGGAGTSATGALLIEDDAPSVQPGQMRKSEFLAAMRQVVCGAVDPELAKAGHSSAGCPYLNRSLENAQDQSPSHLERVIRRYAPQAVGARSAQDYIAAVSERARESAATWAETGQLPDLPPELAGEAGPLGLLQGLEGVVSGLGGAVSSVVSGVEGVVSSIASGIGSVLSGIGSLFFKGRDRAPVRAEPPAVLSGLGPGEHLDAGVQAKMSRAFGHEFSRVKVHADARAADMAAQLNARAFTVADHIAFAGNEYRPGSLEGDVLIAHELAHVVQQSGGSAGSGAGGSEDALESEADRTAMLAAAASSGAGSASGRQYWRFCPGCGRDFA